MTLEGNFCDLIFDFDFYENNDYDKIYTNCLKLNTTKQRQTIVIAVLVFWIFLFKFLIII